MNLWKPIALAILLVATCVAGGCRNPVSLHGRSLSWALEPMYKQPAGYSSTYHRHLKQSAPFVEVMHLPPGQLEQQPPIPLPVPESDVHSAPVDDKVTIPEACGPICEQPSSGNIKR